MDMANIIDIDNILEDIQENGFRLVDVANENIPEAAPEDHIIVMPLHVDPIYLDNMESVTKNILSYLVLSNRKTVSYGS